MKLGQAVAVGAGAAWLGRALWREVNAYDLEGKGVLITGGSRGLGLELARAFAAQGARLALCARDDVELDHARLELEEMGAEVRTFVCDVGDRRAVENMVVWATEELGHIDVLVNNAGVISVGPFEEMTLDDYDEAMRTHFWGPLHVTLAALPAMRARKEGRIVNISSIGGKIAVPHMLPYSASKFALVGFSEGLRAELAKDGVKVTTVCPGLMRTGSPPNATFKGRHRDEYAWFAVADSFPASSMNAARAARQIVRACRYGDAEVVLSFQAKLMAGFHGLFPSTFSDVMGWVNRLLPAPGGIGQESRLGRESESRVTQSLLTLPTQLAAARNNEL